MKTVSEVQADYVTSTMEDYNLMNDVREDEVGGRYRIGQAYVNNLHNYLPTNDVHEVLATVDPYNDDSLVGRFLEVALTAIRERYAHHV